jgi:hypothetical protein
MKEVITSLAKVAVGIPSQIIVIAGLIVAVIILFSALYLFRISGRPNVRKCPHCADMVHPAKRVCPNCGTPLHQSLSRR